MQRRKLDIVRISANIALVLACALLYLTYKQPSTCNDFASVLFALGANVFGLIQKPPLLNSPALELPK